MFASADPSAFDFARILLTLEARVAVRPQCPAHSSTEPMLGFTISFNLHLIFNNQGLHLVSQFYPCWHPVLWSLPSPSSFLLTFPYFRPILQLPPLSAVVVGNWKWELSFGSELRLALGTPLLLLRTVGASQEHSSHFKCCWALASSGVEHVHPFFRQFIWCQPRMQLSIYKRWSRVHFAAATVGNSEN